MNIAVSVTATRNTQTHTNDWISVNFLALSVQIIWNIILQLSKQLYKVKIKNPPPKKTDIEQRPIDNKTVPIQPKRHVVGLATWPFPLHCAKTE